MASAVDLVPTTARQQGEQTALSADELTDSPGEYLAPRLTVRDVSVDDADDILSPRAVALDDDVLVIGASGPMNAEPGFTGRDGHADRGLDGAAAHRDRAPAERGRRGPVRGDRNRRGGEFGDYEYVLVAERFQPGG